MAPQFAEEAALFAFTGAAPSPDGLLEWDEARFLGLKPSANLSTDLAKVQVERILDRREELFAALDDAARIRAKRLEEAHRRVRRSSGERSVVARVEAQLSPDLLGVYVFLPAA